MIRALALAALSLAPALLTPSTGASTAASTARQGDDLPDLKDVCDGAIRWLRGTQDRVDGAYAGGVEGTAWVLRALAESPRHYELGDGPFVRDAVTYLVGRQGEDGAIADADIDAAAARHQTHLAALALFHFSADVKDAYGRALGHLSADSAGMPDDPIAVPEDLEGVTRFARKLLAARDASGRWDGEDGAVIATARAVVELSACYVVLKRAKVEREREAHVLPTWDAKDAARAEASIKSGAGFLLSVADDDGRWGAPGHADAGLTAMVLGALQTVPEPRAAELQLVIDRGLAWLATLQHPDGSIHQGRLANYTTSASILALARSGDPRYQETIRRAQAFLIALQADEGEGYSEGDRYYGGIGYGGDERPDLSNLQMALEALSASGLERNHAAYRRAVKFLERCQNRSETNDVEIVDGDVIIRSGDDGGAGYMPGDSKAGFEVRTEGGKTIQVPRSYGSMTYAMLKSYVFAGLTEDDERVQACLAWLQRNYTLDVNPGMASSKSPTAAYQGLYYYFHSMARALDVLGKDVIVDGEGVEHAWRVELAARVVGMQSRLDHSWTNLNESRWWEGNPVLATSYALLTLDACRK